MAMTLDQTWKVGIGWGLLISILTILGVAMGASWGTTIPLGLGFVAWLVFMAWLERGVK